VRVTDDGSGMDPKDCELALKRHATSKLSALSDLETLGTYGFRGEALFAIAAVSRFSVASCPRGAKNGWRVEAHAGTIVSSGPAPSVPGTTVEAKDLFYNTPARLKFLRSETYEKARLAAVFEEAAIANPSVSWVYKSEGRRVMTFPAETAADALERERRRLSSVLGGESARGLIPISGERPGLKVRMFVSPVGELAATRQFQLWFVNRRPVESRLLQQALYKAYGEHRSKDRHPVCVAHLELPPDSFDVNVHPGKREIRFRSDSGVFEVVSGLIASSLAKAKGAYPLTPEPRVAAALGAVVREAPPAHYLGGRALLPDEPMLAWKAGPEGGLAAEPGAPRWHTPPYRYLGQLEKSYLVFEASGGLFVLDQHAAAERILFEKYLSELGKGQARSQRLMLPLQLELPASAVHKVLSQDERLRRLGFELEAFGKTGLRALAVPAVFGKAADLKEVLHRLLDSLHDPVDVARQVQHDAVATIACKAAVKAHDALSEREALALLDALKACDDGSCCPHGRRTMLALNRDELARRFQRPGAPPL
jgi:DNA mismatch repair protein MutL